MARFNKDAVKQPDLVKLPDLPAEAGGRGSTLQPKRVRLRREEG